MNFIKEDPYPEYDFVSNDLLLKQEQALDQYAESGEINQDLMKEIHENICDKESMKGYTRNGSTTTQPLFTIISIKKALDWPTKRGLHRDTTFTVFYNIKTIVSVNWDGMAEDDEKWRHWTKWLDHTLTKHIIK